MTRRISEIATEAKSAGNTQPIPMTGYLRIKQIIGPDGPLPISRSGFWAGVKMGKFPKPRKISQRVTVWRAEDIYTLLDRIEAGEV